MGWQWHQLDHMQIICTSLQTDNLASTPSLNFLWAGCSSCRPTNGVKALTERHKSLNQPWLRHGLNCAVAAIQDGTERNIESISLIDAVLPEVIEQRKQGALKGSQLKVEAHGPNGEEGIWHLLLYDCIIWNLLLLCNCISLLCWHNICCRMCVCVCVCVCHKAVFCQNW